MGMLVHEGLCVSWVWGIGGTVGFAVGVDIEVDASPKFLCEAGTEPGAPEFEGTDDVLWAGFFVFVGVMGLVVWGVSEALGCGCFYFCGVICMLRLGFTSLSFIFLGRFGLTCGSTFFFSSQQNVHGFRPSI